jgi:hypothetical protein
MSIQSSGYSQNSMAVSADKDRIFLPKSEIDERVQQLSLPLPDTELAKVSALPLVPNTMECMTVVSSPAKKVGKDILIPKAEKKPEPKISMEGQLKILPIMLKRLEKHFQKDGINLTRDLGAITLRQCITICFIDLMSNIYLNMPQGIEIELEYISDIVSSVLNLKGEWSEDGSRIIESFEILIKHIGHDVKVINEHLREKIIPLMKLTLIYDLPINSTSPTPNFGINYYVCSMIFMALNFLNPWYAAKADLYKNFTIEVLADDQINLTKLLLKQLKFNSKKTPDGIRQHQFKAALAKIIEFLSCYADKKLKEVIPICLRILKKPKCSVWEIDKLLLKLANTQKMIQSCKGKFLEIVNEMREFNYPKKGKQKLDISKEEFEETIQDLLKNFDNNSLLLTTQNLLCELLFPILEITFKSSKEKELLLDRIDLEEPEIDFEDIEPAVSKAKSDEIVLPDDEKGTEALKPKKKVITLPLASSEISKSIKFPSLDAVKSVGDLANIFHRSLLDAYDFKILPLPAHMQKAIKDKVDLAIHQQLFANTCLTTLLDLKEKESCTKEESETVDSFILLWSYIASEQGLTATYIDNFPNEILVHRITFFLDSLELPVENSWSQIPFLNRQSIGFRYGHSSGLRSSLATKESDSKERNALPTAEKCLASAFGVQLIALQHFKPDLKETFVQPLQQFLLSWESREKTESFAFPTAHKKEKPEFSKFKGMSKQLSQVMLGVENKLQEMIALKIPDSQVKTLKDAQEHLKNLINLLSLAAHQAQNPLYSGILMHMILLSAQFLIENLGLFLSYKNDDSLQDLWEMTLDIHNFEVYCSKYDLDAVLNGKEKDFLRLLNFGNKGIYPHGYFAKTPRKAVSKLMVFLNDLFERAEISKNAGPDFIPGGKSENYLPLYMEYCEQICGLACKLLKGHILDVKA